MTEAKFALRTCGQVSTGHISPRDDDILRAAAQAEVTCATGGGGVTKHPQVVCAYWGGYIVSAWHGEGEDLQVFMDKLTEMGHTPYYKNIMRVAVQQKLHWLQLDSDAEGYTWLPDVPWDKKGSNGS